MPHAEEYPARKAYAKLFSNFRTNPNKERTTRHTPLKVNELFPHRNPKASVNMIIPDFFRVYKLFEAVRPERSFSYAKNQKHAG